MVEPFNSKKNTRITIETHEIWVLRNSAVTIRRWCPACEAQAEMLVLEGTGILSNLAPGEIEEWLNSQELHQLPGAASSRLICLNSLLRCVPKKEDRDST